jgi:nitrate/nitrite-specific signal transduction histidine kinase
MRERAVRVGGQLHLTSRPGEGTVVVARMPASLSEDTDVARALGVRS